MITPNHLDVFLHYYCKPTQHPRYHAPAVQEALAFFVRNEMLSYERRGDADIEYSATEKGVFWLEHLLSIPMPVTSYKIPQAEDQSK